MRSIRLHAPTWPESRAAPARPRRLARWVFLVCCAAGCVDAPWWHFDRITVEGELRGRTCRVRVDGRDVAAGALPWGGDAVRVGRLTGENLVHEGRSVEVRSLDVSCAGLYFSLADRSPVDPSGRAVPRWLPPPGWYPIGGGGIPFDPDTVRAGFAVSPVSDGRWPLSLCHTSLDARAGWIVLTSVAPDSVIGRFRFVARRVAEGC